MAIEIASSLLPTSTLTTAEPRRSRMSGFS